MDNGHPNGNVTGIGSETQQALLASELSYRRLFEAAQDGILILDVDTGRITDTNPFLCKLLGFSHSEMVGNTVGDLSPFKDIVSNQAMLERLQEQGYVRYEDLPLETKDGRKIAVEFVSNVYQAGDKQVIQCNIRDITERKKTEQQLTLLNTCISHVNDIVLIMEADPIDEPGPRIVFVNKAFERILGYTSAETLGRNPRFLDGEKTDLHTLAELHRAKIEHRPLRTQIIHYGKDGSEHWMDVDLVPIFDGAGKCTHFATIKRDITKQKRIEDKVAEQAEFLDKARDAIMVRSLEGSIIFWNKGAERLYGWTSQEALGRNKRDLLYSDPKIFEEANKLVLEKGQASRELHQITKDRQELTVEARWTLIRDNEGKPKSVLAIDTDITEKKKIEAQFLRAQRMESIGTLAGGVAHDLNNILAPIMMSIDILKTMSEVPEMTKILETIEVSAKRGADIVRQVLSFARGMEGERIEVQPKHLLMDLENIIKDTFPKDIRLQFSIPKDTWTILGDPTQVHQILLNLCVNARDAMPNGGDLTIGVENCVLDKQYTAMNLQAKPGRYVNISVTDSGTGMPPEVIDKIFEPFFTTKALNKGTGLGLSTVMAIVKSHEGIINVYSEPGKGSTFKVYLPAMELSSEALKNQTQLVSPPRGNGETVLVVDDEASILAITGQTLQAFGYRVLTATDGADAVAVYAKHENEIAVVLTDMMMPIMDGPATIHALRRINPTVKIIAASGLIIDNKRLLWSSHVLSRSLQQVREGKSQLSKIEVPTGLRLRARAEGQEMEIASARDISVFMKTAKEAITLHAEGYGGHRDGKLVIKGVVIRRFSSINNRNSSKLSQPDGPMADAHMRGLASEYAASVTPHGNH